MIYCPFHDRKHAKPCFLQEHKKRRGYQAKARRLRRRRRLGPRIASAVMILLAAFIGYHVGLYAPDRVWHWLSCPAC